MTELAAMRWPEITGSRILAVPLGSCEQHGPHLPLNTDTIIAEELSLSLARLRPNVMVAPAISLGASGEHQGFPGTISIGTSTLGDVIVELVRSAIPPQDSGLPKPFAAVLLVNGHGGNVAAVGNAVSLLRTEGRTVGSWNPHLRDADAHAGHTETSLMLHLRPEAVVMDLAEAGNTRPVDHLERELTKSGVLALSSNGVLGNPETANARDGEQIHAQLTDSLVDAADHLEKNRD